MDESKEGNEIMESPEKKPPHFNREAVGVEESLLTRPKETVSVAVINKEEDISQKPLEFDPNDLSRYQEVNKEDFVEYIDPETGQVLATRKGKGAQIFRTESYDSKRDDYIGEKRGRFSVYKDPKTGESVLWIAKVEGGAGVVPDPEVADLANSDSARQWLERQLRAYEGTIQPIDANTKSSLITTIAGKIPDNIIDLATGHPYTHISPDGVPETLRQELDRVARARIGYHNAARAARFDAGNLYDEFADLQPEHHKEIFNTKGVKYATSLLEDNNGRFFRMRSADANMERNRIQTRLSALGLNASEARLALELAEKTMHIFGESAYYDGIRINAGVVYHNAAGAAIPVVDNFISAEVLQALYPDPNLMLEERYARFFEDHWDDINKEDSLTGNGAIYLRGTFYYPILLEKPATRNHGRAEYLRRYAHTWVGSGVRFARYKNDESVRTSMIDVMGNIDSDQAKYFDWTDRAARAYKGRGIFNDKDNESVLNNPIIGANYVNRSNTFQILPKVLENYLKAREIFGALPEDERAKAMTHLLRGILTYVNLPEGRREFSYLHWSQQIENDAITWVMQQRIITETLAVRLTRDLQLSQNQASVQSAIPTITEGFGGFLSDILKGIVRR